MQGGFKFPSPYGDRIFARLERTALTQADRRQYLTFLHGYYRSGGRSDEADDVLRDFEAEFYPVPTILDPGKSILGWSCGSSRVFSANIRGYGSSSRTFGLGRRGQRMSFGKFGR